MTQNFLCVLLISAFLLFTALSILSMRIPVEQIPVAAIPAGQTAQAGDMDKVNIIIMVGKAPRASQQVAHIRRRL